MKLSATDKAIGELNMRKADLERAQLIIEKGIDVTAEITDIYRCIDLLRSVTPAPKLKEVAKVAKSKKRGKSNGAMEADA